MKNRLSLAVLILLFTSACNDTFQIGLEHTFSPPTSRVPFATPTFIFPSFTPTSIPPSPTPQTTATTASAATNIILAPGTTAAVEEGVIQPGQVLTYTLDAGQSQPLILLMYSLNNDVTLGVLEPDGTRLLDPSSQSTHWMGLLPKTEVYAIQVIGGAMTENYTLTAKVAKLVQFASGATSATLNGTTVNGYVFSYALYCIAGQTMTASLNVPSNTAYIDVFGLNTGILLSSANKASSWTGVLPQSQEYGIEVIPNNGQVVDYSLKVSVH